MVSKIRTNPFMHKPTNCRAGMGGSRFLFMFYPLSTKLTGKAIIAAQQELEDMPTQHSPSVGRLVHAIWKINVSHRVGYVGGAEGERHAKGRGHRAALRPQHGGDHLEGQLVARG